MDKPMPAECCTELGAKPDLIDHVDSMSTATIWVLAWLLGGVAIGIPLGALLALF